MLKENVPHCWKVLPKEAGEYHLLEKEEEIDIEMENEKNKNCDRQIKPNQRYSRHQRKTPHCYRNVGW